MRGEIIATDKILRGFDRMDVERNISSHWGYLELGDNCFRINGHLSGDQVEGESLPSGH